MRSYYNNRQFLVKTVFLYVRGETDSRQISVRSRFRKRHGLNGKCTFWSYNIICGRTLSTSTEQHLCTQSLGSHFRVRRTAPQGSCCRELFILAQDQIALKTARYYIIIIIFYTQYVIQVQVQLREAMVAQLTRCRDLKKTKHEITFSKKISLYLNRRMNTTTAAVAVKT